MLWCPGPSQRETGASADPRNQASDPQSSVLPLFPTCFCLRFFTHLHFPVSEFSFSHATQATPKADRSLRGRRARITSAKLWTKGDSFTRGLDLAPARNPSPFPSGSHFGGILLL